MDRRKKVFAQEWNWKDIFGRLRGRERRSLITSEYFMPCRADKTAQYLTEKASAIIYKHLLMWPFMHVEPEYKTWLKNTHIPTRFTTYTGQYSQFLQCFNELYTI